MNDEFDDLEDFSDDGEPDEKEERDRLDRMFGDDLAPKKPSRGKKKKDDEAEKADGPAALPDASNRIFGGVDFLPMPDARDRPAADPLQWLAYEARWGGRPYKTPLDEFCENSHKLNMATLSFRWAGMGVEREIMEIFTDHKSLAERGRRQSIRKREMCLPDPTDKDDQKIENSYQLQIAKDRIAYLNFLLEQNAMPTTENYFMFKQGGTVIKEEIRTLSPSNRTRIENDLMKWIDVYRMLTEQPTKITAKKVDHEHTFTGSVADLFTERLIGINHTTRAGHSFADLLADKPLELPAAGDTSEVVEGEIMPDTPIVYHKKKEDRGEIDPFAHS